MPARNRSASHTLKGDAVLEVDVERSMENDTVPNPLANRGRRGINDCSKAGATQRVDREGRAEQAGVWHASTYASYTSHQVLSLLLSLLASLAKNYKH